MVPIYFPSGWYVDATLQDHAVLFPGQRVETSRGPLSLPSGGDVLQLRCDEIAGRFCVAGQGHDDGLAWLHNSRFWAAVGQTYGTSACAFGPLGLYVSTPHATDNIRVYDVQSLNLITTFTKPLGVRGIARVTGAGTSADDIHSVDAWYGQDGFGEFDQIAPGLRVGEGANGGLAAKDQDGPLVLLEPGSNRFVRARLYGSTIVAAAWQEDRRRAVVLRLDRSELPGLVVSDPVVTIGRDLWMGFFAGSLDAEPPWTTTTRPQSLPGNCYLKVADMLVYTMSGVPIAQYVAAEAVGQTIATEVAKARARHPGLPVIPYWTRQDHGGAVPPGDWIGVEAYRGVAESVAAFEARLHRVVERCRQVVLIPQCYTNNPNNTPDLASIVPVVARVALVHAPVKGMLAFSGSGRATGLQEHPEVRALWDQLAAGVTTPPVIIVDPGPPPPPPPLPPPSDRYPRARYYEVTMDSELVGLVGAAGKFARIDPREMGQGSFGGCPVHFDRDSPDDEQCRFELTKPDDKFALKALAANVLLSVDATGYSEDLCTQFGTRPLDQRGAYESPTIVRLPSGLVIAFIEYDTNGQKYTSAPVTVVKL